MTTATNHEAAIDALAAHPTSRGVNLVEHSRTKPVLLVFLRHFGCTFCREAARDVADNRAAIEGVADIAFVHMGSATQAGSFFSKYGLADAHHVSDPDRDLYRAFELHRGNLAQLFGPNVWIRGFRAGIVNGHWVGKLVGDGFQMPGIFRIEDGRVAAAHRHASAADRPDYAAFAAAPAHRAR